MVGDDGLKLADFPDLKIESELDGAGNAVGGTVSFLNTPAQVVCRKAISKAGHTYFVFLPPEACQYLKNYLEWRMRTKVYTRKTWSHGREKVGVLEEVRLPGEKLTPESPLIGAIKNQKSSHISTNKVCVGLKQAIVAAGFTWRPYVLRRYFDSALMLAESKGKVSHAYQQFFMGHRGDIEHTYTVGKGRLSTEVIEDMRSAYSRCDQFLSTQKNQSFGGESIKDQLKREILLGVAGYSAKEVEAIDLSNMEDAEFQKLVHEKLLGTLANNGNRQKVV